MHKPAKIVLLLGPIILLILWVCHGPKQTSEGVATQVPLSFHRFLQGEEYASVTGYEGDYWLSIVSPRHGSFVIGDEARIEIIGCSATPAFDITVIDE